MTGAFWPVSCNVNGVFVPSAFSRIIAICSRSRTRENPSNWITLPCHFFRLYRASRTRFFRVGILLGLKKGNHIGCLSRHRRPNHLARSCTINLAGSFGVYGETSSSCFPRVFTPNWAMIAATIRKPAISKNEKSGPIRGRSGAMATRPMPPPT